MANEDDEATAPKGSSGAKWTRGALQAAGGAVPFAGGILSAIAGAWSEKEQEKVNRFFEQWIRMLRDELREKEETVAEIMARLDLQDEEISRRVESAEFQSLVKRTFRNWAAVESEDKRVLIRNILTNAAATHIASDDVIRLFIDWIDKYSELHFSIVGAIYNSAGITRGEIWEKIGKGTVREDSADADLFKLLIRDLTTGSVIRQHRETDYQGNFLAKRPAARGKAGSSRVMKSAFDDAEQYELTELGNQFVHYAMTELTPRVTYDLPPEAAPDV